MKRLLFSVLTMIVALCVNAQIMRTEELETYAKSKYGEKWEEAAANLASSLILDKNKALTYTQVVECPGKTKEQLYVILNYWFTASFNDANSVIQMNDKDAGCIIGQGYMKNVAVHVGGMNGYEVSLKPIIKVDIKDEKVRINYTIQSYDVVKYMSMPKQILKQVWTVDQCYPFLDKDKHKKTSSKALIMAHAYSNVMIDKIEEAVKNGLTGNENEDW